MVPYLENHTLSLTLRSLLLTGAIIAAALLHFTTTWLLGIPEVKLIKTFAT
ncbi:MAG: hypothetical protein HQL07_17545 [Nitrospirae bacterium]|nr:hypothetical protein [Magnetococcales bacterium]